MFQYLTFLEQLSDKMKLDRIAAEIGFDMRLDAILVRAEQLVKLEGDAVIENKTMAHNLQRKVVEQKLTSSSVLQVDVLIIFFL